MMLAILQARMSSTRLPGKILKPILGEPMLMRQLERLARCVNIDRLCVATTRDQSDDPVVELCDEHSIDVFRGDEHDVLDRYYQSAKTFNAEHVVRLTGDCPLADPELIDDVICYYSEGEYDFVSNCIHPTFPDGLDVAVFSWKVLEESWRNAKLPSHREHVTLYARESKRFRIGSYENNADLSHYRWTVDEMDDYDFANRIYEELYRKKPEFTSKDIYDLLASKPEIIEMNSKYTRNEGLTKSLACDRVWSEKNDNEA